jgi:hypothetical protein
MPWHKGEEKMHKLTRMENQENPSSSRLVPRAAQILRRAPSLALGTIDETGKPWATICGGDTPLAQPVAQSTIGIRTIVDGKTDQVVDSLYGGKDDGEVVKE